MVTWENVFPWLTKSAATQSSAPSKGGILKARIPDFFRCTRFPKKSMFVILFIGLFLFGHLQRYCRKSGTVLRGKWLRRVKLLQRCRLRQGSVVPGKR